MTARARWLPALAILAFGCSASPSPELGGRGDIRNIGQLPLAGNGCGARGERCCGPDREDVPCDTKWLRCQENDICGDCGALGQSCCEDACQDGLACEDERCSLPRQEARPVAFYEAKQGQVVKMWPATEGFCALTGIAGDLQGGGEIVDVYVGSDGYWRLSAQSGQGWIRGEAHCVAHDAFLADSEVRQSFPVQGRARATAQACEDDTGPFTPGCTCHANRGAVEHGDAVRGGLACSVSRISGRFSGSEAVQTLLGSVEVTSCGPPWVQGEARCMYFGQTRVAYDAPNEFRNVSTFPNPTEMSLTSRAFCYLTKVSGQFRGGAEFVRISRNEDSGSGRWYLRAGAGAAAGNAGTRGTARCVLYDQRWNPPALPD
ncbi:MAG: hypothetical protein RMA76_05530 [Deltaproteobacteria bacterium]|jgi:hypothetical protein